MLLTDLVETSRRVAETRSRLAKIGYLAARLRQLAAQEIEIGVGFLLGDLRQGRVGLGLAMLREALPAGAAPQPSLTVTQVDAVFDKISRTTGQGSVGERQRLLAGMLERATVTERDFIARLVLGELRQGALEGVLLEAVARAADVPAADVRRALMLTGSLSTVARAVLTDGAAGLEQFTIRLLEPVKPMLAQSAETVSDALTQLDRPALEFKVDGARVQVHKAGGDVRVFSRRLNDVTVAVPEIAEAVGRLPVAELILDGEALALRQDGTPQPFQVTMRRFGRKLHVTRMREELPLAALFFDCLHLEGEDLIDRPAAERFAALEQLLPTSSVIPRRVTRQLAEAEAFLGEALRGGHEGLIAKALDAVYEAGNRGSNWLKVKPSHCLDLVVLAAEWGHGRRRGWLSNLHLGARDPGGGGFAMLGKTFKGMSDKMLAWQTGRLLELAITDDSYTVYVRPELVVEVVFNEIQASLQYPAGLALRFARIKHYRPDKGPEDADTIDTVRAIYERRLARRDGAG